MGNDQEGSRKLQLLAGNPKDRTKIQVHVRSHASDRWWYGILGRIRAIGMESGRTCRHCAIGLDSRLPLLFAIRAQPARGHRRGRVRS